LENQDCGEIEIAICNDASTDRTSTIINKWKKISRHRIVSLENQLNLGPSYSFREAVKLSSAKFILALGDDDLLGRKHISTLYRTLDVNEEAAAVFARAKGWRSHINLLRTLVVLRGKQSNGVVGLAHLLAGNSVHGPGALFRRSIFVEEPMHSTNIYSQDYELWLFLSMHGQMIYTNIPMNYGKTPGSLSQFPGIAKDLDLGLCVRRFLLSERFQNYTSKLTGEERLEVHKVFNAQLDLLRLRNPVAHGLAVFGTAFKPNSILEDPNFKNLIMEITRTHDYPNGWTLEGRNTAINNLELWLKRREVVFNRHPARGTPKALVQFLKEKASEVLKLGQPSRLRSLTKPWEIV
jgi:glycosyltransferase involved in cell wall biosynthesis